MAGENRTRAGTGAGRAGGSGAQSHLEGEVRGTRGEEAGYGRWGSAGPGASGYPREGPLVLGTSSLLLVTVRGPWAPI